MTPENQPVPQQEPVGGQQITQISQVPQQYQMASANIQQPRQ